jgi:hypothetical protein
VACNVNWAYALSLWRQGYLYTSRGGGGGPDLARAAREAARVPDRDRGLDEFLAKLPAEVIEPPHLHVEPTEVNLGEVQPGPNRAVEIHLANKGMRLLVGSVTCADCDWLTVGEGPGMPRRYFQLHGELDLPVQVRGDRLRAGSQPLAGRLRIESNGGAAAVTVRIAVPVKPYPSGFLAGAQSPRQLVDRLRERLQVDSPEAAAAPFEDGSVARWYRENGWAYPVQGPVEEGAAAVQQFLDALGLSNPLPLEVRPPAVTLRGNVGAELEQVLELISPEKRPAYAFGVSNQPWLEIGRARREPATGALTLPLSVPAVPDREGETLHARVSVLANGKQRLAVPVTLEVVGGLSFVPAAPLVTVPRGPAPGDAGAANATAPTPGPQTEAPRPARRHYAWLAGVLTVVLLAGIAAWTLGKRAVSPPPETTDPEPRLEVRFNSKMRFGILSLQAHDPARPDRYKRLTAAEDGRTNNTCVRLDGLEHLFGQEPGEWAKHPRTGRSLREVRSDEAGRPRWTSVWYYPKAKLWVRQTVELVRNEQTNRLDTCLVHYLLENQDAAPHQVGLRVMVDTYVGSHDGVPFAAAGRRGLLDAQAVFGPADVPDFLEALEKPALNDPGTVAHMEFRLPAVRVLPSDPEPEPLQRLVVCRWPGNSEKRWEWDFAAMSEAPEPGVDSCVVLYWPDRVMAQLERRALAFSYGLGRLSGGANLAVSAGGVFRPGGLFTVMAYVANPAPGQTATVHLPPGLRLEPEGTEEQHLEPGGPGGVGYTAVSWRVQAETEGAFPVEVASGRHRERATVRVRAAGLLDGQP